MSFSTGPFVDGPFKAGPFRAGPFDLYGVLWDFAATPPPAAAAGFRRTGLGTLTNVAGNVVYGDHNLLLNSATLSTQNVTTVAQQYTLKFSGAGTVTLSGTGSGVLSAGTNTFTATAGTLTLTVSGSVTTAQLNAGASATAYVETTTTAVYLPRIQHSATAPHTALGLLDEPQMTQQVTNSHSFTGADWVNDNVTVSAGVAGPSFFGAYSKLTAAATAASVLVQPHTINDSKVTMQCRLKKGSSATAFNRFGFYNVITGANLVIISINYDTIAITYDAGSSGATLVDLGGGHLMLTMTASITSGDVINTYFGGVGSSNAAGEYVYIADPQIEAGAVATSYIPNVTTGSLVRSGDGNWDITGSDFTQLWGSGSERTIIVEWYDTGTALEHGLVMGHVGGSIANEAIGLYVNTSNELIYYAKAGGAAQATLTAGTIVAGTLAAPGRNKAAFRFGSGAFGVTLNGAAEVTGTGTIPTVTDLRVAGAALVAANPYHDILKALGSRPTAITGAALQALSAL